MSTQIITHLDGRRELVVSGDGFNPLYNGNAIGFQYNGPNNVIMDFYTIGAFQSIESVEPGQRVWLDEVESDVKIRRGNGE